MHSSNSLFSEDELLPISSLQHLLFCERQWALIHLEQQWEENRLTQEGRVLHERVHDAGTEARPGAVVARGLRIRSLRLGLSGETDVVEFQRAEQEREDTIQLEGRRGWWVPFPVEYKRGKPKSDACDEVQLCAQALCLEESFGVTIAAGALFYATHRRRTRVEFDSQLRTQTENLARHLHELFAARTTPPAVYGKKCEKCSLIERCMPKTSMRRPDVERYLATALRDVEVEG